MRPVLLLFVCYVVSVEAVVEIVKHSEMPLVAWIRRVLAGPGKAGFFAELIKCGWCLSVWVAGGLAVFWILWIPEVYYVLAAHRLSNFLHFGWSLLKLARFRKRT